MLKAKKMKQITNPPLWHTDSAFTTLASDIATVNMEGCNRYFDCV